MKQPETVARSRSGEPATKVVVISPESDHPREHAVLLDLFAAGLERLHVRKPNVARNDLELYLRRIPAPYRSRVVLHQHHDLVSVLGLGGRHWRDQTIGDAQENGRAGAVDAPREKRPSPDQNSVATHNGFKSRSCHTLDALQRSFGRYDAAFFGPVFPSLSKPGYGPATSQEKERIRPLLQARSDAQRRTSVIALGGIDAETAPRAQELGFDGVAVLGAVWQAADPLAAFLAVRAAVALPRSTATGGTTSRGLSTAATNSALV